MTDNIDPFELRDPETGEVFKLNPNQLVQDIRDTLLRSLRENAERTPWPKMSEADQREAVENMEDIAMQLVRGTVEIVAQGKNDVVHAVLDKFTIKDGTVQIVASGLAEDNVLLTLNHAGKKAVKIVVADAEQFDKRRDPAQVMRDQPILFDDEAEGGDQTDADNAYTPENPDDEGGDQFDNEAEQEAGRQLLSDEYRGGHNSRMGGYQITECPFDGRTKAGKDWKAGWNAADAKPDAPPINEDGEPAPVPEPEIEPLSPRNLGYQAGAEGKGADANPYDTGSDDSFEWLRGLDQAIADMKEEVAASSDEQAAAEDLGEADPGNSVGESEHSAEAAANIDYNPETGEVVEEKQVAEMPDVPLALPKENQELNLTDDEYADQFRRGASARTRGEPVETNPYLGDGPMERSWADGWKAQDEMMQPESDAPQAEPDNLDQALPPVDSAEPGPIDLTPLEPAAYTFQYARGWKAQAAGQVRTSNPHRAGSSLWTAWDEGWQKLGATQSETETIMPEDPADADFD